MGEGQSSFGQTEVGQDAGYNESMYVRTYPCKACEPSRKFSNLCILESLNHPAFNEMDRLVTLFSVAAWWTYVYSLWVSTGKNAHWENKRITGETDSCSSPDSSSICYYFCTSMLSLIKERQGLKLTSAGSNFGKDTLHADDLHLRCSEESDCCPNLFWNIVGCCPSNQ